MEINVSLSSAWQNEQVSIKTGLVKRVYLWLLYVRASTLQVVHSETSVLSTLKLVHSETTVFRMLQLGHKVFCAHMLKVYPAEAKLSRLSTIVLRCTVR